jgi:hypothetical protein
MILLAGLLLSIIATAQESTRIAVLVYGQNSGLNEFFQNELITAFSDDGTYTVCERQEEFISLINKEHTYQQSGMIDDRNIVQIAKKLGAEYVCCFKMLDLIFGEQPVAARILSVEQGSVIRSVQWSGAMTSMNDVHLATKEICRKITRSKDL